MSNWKHMTGLKNLERADIDEILNLAESLDDICSGRKVTKVLEDKLMATFFYEPSTRTRFSFEAAMQRLGGKVISMADALASSSAWKGESLGDTIRTIDNYADVIVLRHSVAGAAEEAASYSRVPILSAGDGTNEHPTQGLLDMLTIRKEHGKLDGLKVSLIGDLKHTRSTNSLTLGLSNYDVELNLVSPKGFETQDWIVEKLRKNGVKYTQTDDINTVAEGSDVVYICRIQKERLETPEMYDKIKGVYVVNRALLERNSKIASVLHHLPRVGELSEDVDDYPGAAYFKQPYNGVLVRAALILMALDRRP
ncbi:MAG: aspartate carbamoyltransferase [Anaerolineaceae bacterium]|jgi:aspartate carbamoyltransferase catalytic subunit